MNNLKSSLKGEKINMYRRTKTKADILSEILSNIFKVLKAKTANPELREKNFQMKVKQKFFSHIKAERIHHLQTYTIKSVK